MPLYFCISSSTCFIFPARIIASRDMLRRSKSITARNTPRNLKPQRARQIIRRFHVLQKNRSAILQILQAKCDAPATSYTSEASYQRGFDDYGERRVEEKHEFQNLDSADHLLAILGKIDAEIAKRGGLDTYQMASTVGQNQRRGGDSLKRLVQWLGALNRQAASALEIGLLLVENAISTLGCCGHVTRIDLHANHSAIVQQDFMERPVPRNQSEKFELISCSLVLNFVPAAPGRGEMLRHITRFLLEPSDTCRPGLFLVLPLPCVLNSRYFDAELLAAIMTLLGFEQVEYYEAKKVAYWLYDWRGSNHVNRNWENRKVERHAGSKRNNFFIQLQRESKKK